MIAALGLSVLITGPMVAIVAIFDRRPLLFAFGATIAVIGIALILVSARLWIEGWIEEDDLVMAGVAPEFARAMVDKLTSYSEAEQ